MADREKHVARSRLFYHVRKGLDVKVVNGLGIQLVGSVLADALGGPMEHQPVTGLDHPLRAGPRPLGLLSLCLDGRLGGDGNQSQTAPWSFIVTGGS